MCWGKSIINQKTASNAAASARIDELKDYIADLDSGRIELISRKTSQHSWPTWSPLLP